MACCPTSPPAGCVFPRYKPTYTFSESKYPAAAAHISLLQKRLPSHVGLKGKGGPLNFLANDTPQKSDPTKMQKDVNRDVICGVGQPVQSDARHAHGQAEL